MRAFRITVVFVLSFISLVARAQSEPYVKSARTFHVQGTLRNVLEGEFIPRNWAAFEYKPALQRSGGTDSKAASVPIPPAQITFDGPGGKITITVDKMGFYHADLPLGFYKMTVRAPWIFTRYERTFRVDSPKPVVLNGSLYLVEMSCDDISVEARKNFCAGDDSFSIPSKDGTPLELRIRYLRRQPTDDVYLYQGEAPSSAFLTPVFLTYNLFSLKAKAVSYDAKTQTLRATGGVITENGLGMTSHAETLSVRIDNGQVVPLNP